MAQDRIKLFGQSNIQLLGMLGSIVAMVLVISFKVDNRYIIQI
jgi:hypothetical protein